MTITAVRPIYFSPTQTTQKIVRAIGQGTQFPSAEDMDLTLSKDYGEGFFVAQDQMAIIGSPVYAGRIPLTVLARLQALKGTGGPAVIVVVYGNRAYEDALVELRDVVTAAGFTVIAAASFIGEHSYSTNAAPIGAGRPDREDLSKAEEFGKKIRECTATLGSLRDPAVPVFPGQVPYKERNPLADISPDTLEPSCLKCCRCSSVCPTGAVEIGETVITDKGGCIRCCACIKNCPAKARVMREPRILQMAEQLAANCRVPKEPEMYLSTLDIGIRG